MRLALKHKVAIIGGGITGLALAYRLSHLKHKHDLPIEVALFEGSNRLGGVIKSEQIDNFVIEHGPDAFLADRPELKNLLSELNLTEKLLPTNSNHRKAFVARKGELIPIPAGFFMIAPTKLWPFIFTPVFSLLGKLRIIFETWLPPKKIKQSDKDTDESVKDFLLRRFGNELFNRIGQPLLGSIYMADISLLSAKSSIPYFVNLEAEYGSVIRALLTMKGHGLDNASGARYNLFSSFANGTEVLIDALTKHLGNTRIYLNTKLRSVSKSGRSNWLLQSTDGRFFDADTVVITTPANLAADIVQELDLELSNALASIKNSSSVIVNLLYKKSDMRNQPNGFGFVLSPDENKNIIACGFISKKFAYRVPTNCEMVRAFIGGQLAPHLFQLTDQELKNIAHQEVSRYLQIKNPPQKVWLSRCPQGLPIYKVGHEVLVKTIENRTAAHKGLFFAGSSYYGVGIPDCIRSSEITANMITNMIFKSMDRKEQIGSYASKG